MEIGLYPRLAPVGEFPSRFLGWLLGFGVVTILFIFYFSRLLAFVLTQIVQTYLWHYYRSAITIEAIQFSPLGGRIFVKNLRYYGRNEIISIAGFYITWKYWLRHVLPSELSAKQETTAEETASGKKTPKQTQNRGSSMKRLARDTHTRVMIDARGLEWFVFNRSPAYDAVLASVSKSNANSQARQSQAQPQRINPNTIHPSIIQPVRSSEKDKELSTDSAPLQTPLQPVEKPDQAPKRQELPSFLKLLPIGVVCKRAAMVMGNDYTKSILVATTSDAEGLIDARAAGLDDLYKQCFDFALENLTVHFRPNVDYDDSILNAGSGKTVELPLQPQQKRNNFLRHPRKAAIHALHIMFPQMKGSVESLVQNSPRQEHGAYGQHLQTGQTRWLGLSRYLEPEEDELQEHERWRSIEYAQVSTIADCPRVVISFYWDVPGKVTTQANADDNTNKVPLYQINGGIAPEWGFDINIAGGTFNYGPWSDRQRANLQTVFFPSAYTSAIASDILRQGQQRQSTQFKINITLDDTVTLKLHTREETKDWRWKGVLKSSQQTDNPRKRNKKREKGKSDTDIRPAGWLYLTAAADSTITYTMDMFATSMGFGNHLKVDVPSLLLTTSVNHGQFLKSDRLTMNCDLSNPLEWNALRTWVFDIGCRNAELFFIRDHAFLLVDLINDWTAGPPSDFMTFVPFLYKFNLIFNDLKVHLNANDANIIDVPASPNDNVYLLFGAEKLHMGLEVSAVNYRPQRNSVKFDGVLDELYLELLSPTWSTLHSLLRQKRLGKVKKLSLDGCYDYYTSSFPSQTDTLTMNLHGDSLILHVYGFLIRKFLIFRENYFGDDMHFQTLEEYQQRLATTGVDTGTRADHISAKLTNDLDVILTIKTIDSCLVLPSGIYSAEEHVRVDIPSVGLDLRFTNYYMDLDVSFSTTSMTRGFMSSEEMLSESRESSVQLFIDGIWLSGHRLFGLPPTEPTYVCNWDFLIGSVLGQCSLEFIASLAAAGRSIAFQFRDIENALPRNQPKTIHDVTFLRLKTADISLALMMQDAAIQLKMGESLVEFNDLAGETFSEGLVACVPDISIAIVDIGAVRQNARRKRETMTYALLQTSIDIKSVEIAGQFQAQRKLQQDHVRKHDSRTERTPWLLLDQEQNTTGLEARIRPRPPAMPFPSIPPPLHNSRSGKSSLISSSGKKSLTASTRTQDSFLLKSRSGLPPQSSQPKFGYSGKYLNSDPGARIDVFSNISSTSRFASRPSRLAFASPYDAPKFAMLDIHPDRQYLPVLDPPQAKKRRSDYSDENNAQSQEEDIVHSTIIVSCRPGVAAYMTPEALGYINTVIGQMQASNPSQVLDDIQMGALPKVPLGFNRPKARKSIQFRVEVPQVAMRLMTQSTANSAPFPRQNYELGLTRLVLTVGTRPRSQGQGLESNVLTMHLSLQQLQASVRGQQNDTIDDEARIQLSIDRTTAWFCSSENTAIEIRTEEFELVSLNRKVEYLAAIVNNTLTLVESLTPQFAATKDLVERRQQCVVHYLLRPTFDLADPAFLNNGSHIARASKEHARKSDTWKMISRLRYVLQNLSRLSQQDLETVFHDPPAKLTSNQIEEVVAAFNKWRGWDLEYLRTSAFMRQVFKSHMPVDSSAKVLQQLNLEFNLNRFVVLVDPGADQNRVELQHITLAVESTMQNGQVHDTQSLMSRATNATIFCDETVIQLNWTITEVVEGLLRQSVKHSNPDQPRSETNASNQYLAARKFLHKLHMVTAFETIDFELKTINLELISLTRSLKFSTTVDVVPDAINHATVLAHAEMNATRISSHQQPILVMQILQPSSHGALLVESDKSLIRNKWNGGGLCQKLELEIKQDLLSMLGVADLLVKDEAARLQKMISVLKNKPLGPREPSTRTNIRKKHNEVHVALLLEDYRLSVALLSSLHYVLRGYIARSTIFSTAGHKIGVLTNFNVREHTHVIENHRQQSVDEVASFLLPTINGKVSLFRQEQHLRVSASIASEKVSLDGSAVHALFNTISRREVSAFRQNVSKDFNILLANVKTMFLTETSAGPDASSPFNIVYKAEFIGDGLNITALTAKTSKQPARVVFDIGPVFVNVRNQDDCKQALPMLEARVDVQDIQILLERSNGHQFHGCGDVLLGFSFVASSAEDERGSLSRSIEVFVMGPEVNLYAETAPTIVDTIGYLQQRFKDFSLSEEIHTIRARRNRSKSVGQFLQQTPQSQEPMVEEYDAAAAIFSTGFTVDISDVQIAWRVGDLEPISPGHDVEDLVFSIDKISLATRHTNSAKLVLANLQLQMVAKSESTKVRSRNSALMPEVLFNVAYISTPTDRRLAFQAVGKSVDLRLTPQFVLPAAGLQKSIALATQDLRKVIADWNASFIKDEQNKKLISAKRLASILVDADFAGAIVNLQSASDVRLPITPYSPTSMDHRLNSKEPPKELGRASAILRTPGIAFKVEYRNFAEELPSLSSEIKINASSNALQPSLIPLILELTKSVREVVHEKDNSTPKPVRKSNSPTTTDEELITNPVAILGDTRLNLGLRICRQSFAMTCAPIAKVEAQAQFEDVYITVNTVQAPEGDRFLTACARIENLQATVQHTYSQEATGRFVADHIEISLMNSKHVSDVQGISAILNFGPMTIGLNVRQLHDFLLFREIWLPEELQQSSAATDTPPLSNEEPQGFVMKRYQEVATSSPFPWNATIAVAEINVGLDLGQSLGKSSFQITKFWTASKKLSNWEQNLHIGFEKIKLDCAGRLNCYLALENMALRTAIKWQESGRDLQQIPLVQASMGFEHFMVKAAFEYQAFLVSNFSSLQFLMYNVRDGTRGRDRLVCMIDGDKIQAYCTTQSSATMLALHQAVMRLIQEKKQSMENALKDVHRYYNRTKTNMPNLAMPSRVNTETSVSGVDEDKLPLQLQTNVVVSLKQLNVGVYPRSFADSTIFKLDASDAQARFSVRLRDNTIESSLGLGLGQVRIALSNINRSLDLSSFEELSIDSIIQYSTGSRGGTILKVPRVNAGMQTWQIIGSTMVEYVFRSAFEGKVEVGWNINRINVIRNMWSAHSKALASRLGKTLTQSAVQITGVPTEETNDKEKKDKITAVVNVPLSKYTYTAREPPIIETPQLRDMGEATPPLEWIGLQRDKLPNITHQIVIQPLLEIAKSVEDAYEKVLGAS